MRHGAQPFATATAMGVERGAAHDHKHGAAHGHKHPHGDRHLRVLLYTSKPYIESDRSGFYYAIWQKIKDQMNTMKHDMKDGERMTHYFFTEDFAPGYFLGYDEVERAVYEEYDVIVGMFDGALPNDVRDLGWNVSNPLFLHKSVVVEKNDFSFFKMFYNLFFKKYLPLLIIFISLSVLLGQLLFKYTKRMSRRNAVWQTLSAMMGEFGYLSEKLSDHYREISYIGYFVNMVVFIICLYCFLYIQATINTTMIYSKQSHLNNPNDDVWSDRTDKRKYITNQKHVVGRNVLSGSVDLRDGARASQYESTKALMRDYEKIGGDGNTREYDGMVLDAVMANDIQMDGEMYVASDVASQTGVGILVRDAGVINEINRVVQMLHASDDIRTTCSRHIKGGFADTRNQCAL